MCTLAIVPVGAGGYLLAHNRDESARRSRGLPPARSSARGSDFIAPRDPDGGGSWIAASVAGITFALLNAAHVEPGSLPPLPPTRGRILDAVAGLRDPDEVEAILAADPDLASTKGFHLVMAIPGRNRVASKAHRYRWNGRSLDHDEQTLPALFVSSGYDQAGAEAARASSWRRLLDRTPSPGVEDLAAWMATHEPERGIRSVCMHGPHAATVSRTIVEVTDDSAHMRYLDGAPCDPRAHEHFARIPRLTSP